MKRFTFKVQTVGKELNQLIALADRVSLEKADRERMVIEQAMRIIESSEPAYFMSFFELREGILERLTNRDSSYSDIMKMINLKALEKKIDKLMRLLNTIKTGVLGRVIIDVKSMFRTKVQFLFKNLDDAHGINYLFGTNEINNLPLNTHYQLWRTKSKQLYKLPRPF